MAVLEPRLAILDETDSGLDIDALRMVAGGVNALRSPERSMIVVTHYQRLLNYIVPDFVHVLSEGRIVKSGGKELALELEESGYAGFGIFDEEEAVGKGMTAVSEQIGNWLEAFAKQDASPFQALREAGFRRFAELGFPTTHDEEWRFTNVAPIARGKFVAAPPVAPGDIDQLAPWTAGNRLVFVNGLPGGAGARRCRRACRSGIWMRTPSRIWRSTRPSTRIRSSR